MAKKASGKKKRGGKKKADWAEAKRRARLSAEEVQMAKELGMGPKSVIKNIPNRSERWKEPVGEWIRKLYRKRFGNRRPAIPKRG